MSSAGRSNCRRTDVIEIGKRNDTLFRAACSLRGQGAEQDEIVSALLKINRSECEEPLPEAEARKVAASAASYPKGSPKVHHLPWFPMYPDSILSDQRISLMDDEQFRWFFHLYLQAWKTGGWLPVDMKQLHTLARTKRSLAKFQSKFAPLMTVFEFDAESNRLKIPELVDSYEKQLKLYKQRVDAGRKSQEKQHDRNSVPTERDIAA